MMKYEYHKPNPRLIDYVQSIVAIEPVSGPAVSSVPLFTNGMPALLYQLTTNNQLTFTLFGKQIPAEDLTVEHHTTLIGFFFKPFVLGPIFKLSAKELKNPIELKLWNAQKTITIYRQLINAKSTSAKIDILNHFILSQFEANKRECEVIRYATDQMMLDPSGEILSKLLIELNLTERTFQRIFKKYIGVTANQYRRICQFHLAFFQLKGNDFEKLTDVAYTNGYFDQSHYIRSFKEFTNTTPNDYLQFGLEKKNK